jgi:hypothetical protein
MATIAESGPQIAEGEHTVPAGVLSPLVEVVKHWNVAPDELLGPLGLREQDLSSSGNEGMFGLDAIPDFSFDPGQLPVFADPQTSLDPLFATDPNAFGL